MGAAPVPNEAELLEAPAEDAPAEPNSVLDTQQSVLEGDEATPTENKTLVALKSATETVVEFVKTRREELEQEQDKDNIDALRCRIGEMKISSNTMTARWQIHTRHELERKISGMEEHIETLESKENLVAFDRDSRRFFTAFTEMVEQQKVKEVEKVKNPPPPVKKRKVAETKVRRRHVTKPELYVLTFGEANAAAFADAFMERHGDPTLKQRPLCSLSNDNCAQCGGQLKHDSQVDMLVCQNCQNEQSSVHSSRNIGYSNAGSMNLNACRYRREGHFITHLNRFQGSEGADKVTPEVLDRVMGWLKQQRIPEHKVNTNYVQQAIDRLDMKKHSNHVFIITSKLTGKPLPKFSPDEMSQLVSMFLRVNDAYSRLHKQGAFPHRVNFLNYSFCIFKFLELLTWGGKKFMKHFSVLKGRDNLCKQDCDWKVCCEATGLRFINTI